MEFSSGVVCGRLVLFISLLASISHSLRCIQPMRPAKVSGYSWRLFLQPAAAVLSMPSQRYTIDDFINQNVQSYSSIDGSVRTVCRSSEDLEDSNVSQVGSGAETVVLVDLAVRSFMDIERLEQLDGKYSSLVSKCKGLGDDLSKDKFLYSYDVGGTRREVVSIARIPTEMHQKLELSRRLAEAHASTNITVYMVSSDTEFFCDAAMSEAVLSGLQMQRLSGLMPSMKRRSSASREHHHLYANWTVEFILPSSMFEAHNDSLPSEAPSHHSDQLLDGGRSDELNYQIKGLPDVQTKISALESAMLEAASKSAFQYQDIHSRDADTINRMGIDEFRQLLQEAIAVNSGTHLSRQLAALPPNILTPGAYSRVLHSIAKARNFQIEEWTAEQLRDMGCGAFYAVTQADQAAPDKSGRLVRLSTSLPIDRVSTPRSLSSISSMGASLSKEADARFNAGKPIVLVGKGVCYDTGGINLKSAGSMKGMKADMAGSAAALGAFIALQSTDICRSHHPIECWLALSENNVNALAFRPDDVLTAVTGDSIEVVHSDAEGRLLLADVLALASRKVVHPLVHGRGLDVGHPTLLLDFATLTGTCISSLSSRYIGAFTNRPSLVRTIMEVGAQCGERAWPFPLDSDFEDDLRSDVADLLQCRVQSEADHIYAAAFLNKVGLRCMDRWIDEWMDRWWMYGYLCNTAPRLCSPRIPAAAAVVREDYSPVDPSGPGVCAQTGGPGSRVVRPHRQRD